MKFRRLTFSFYFLLAVATMYAQEGIVNSDKNKALSREENVRLSKKTYKQHFEEAQKQKAELSLKLIQTRREIADKEIELSAGRNSNYLGKIKNDISVLRSKELQLKKEVQVTKFLLGQIKEMEHWSEQKRFAAIEKIIDEQKGTNQVQRSLPKKYSQVPEMNVLLNPPKPPCQLSIFEEGETASRYTKPQLLFGFTNKSLEEHYPDRDFITCYGSLTMATGGLKILNLGVIIATHKAQKIYGKFQKGGFLFIQFLDGTVIALPNRTEDFGRWGGGLSAYLFEGQYIVGVKEEQLLRTKLMDKITIQWSKAQDEFEIFELDFFINHFECLESG